MAKYDEDQGFDDDVYASPEPESLALHQGWTIGDDGLFDSIPSHVDHEYKKDYKYDVKIVPRVIVVHYGVTHSLDMLSGALLSTSNSAHIGIDGFKDAQRASVMQVCQYVPFNIRAGHAGRDAVWKGQKGVNNFSIGIEISNPGPLIMRADGKLVTDYGKEWPIEDAIEARHQRNRAPGKWTHWAKYTDEEYGLLVSICLALIQKYPTIVDIVGHDEIRKDKYDPGPAFNMPYLYNSVFGVLNA